MPEKDAKAAPITGDTVRVRFLTGVEVDGSRHAPGAYEADLTADEAKALVDAGRGEIVGEPMKATDETPTDKPDLPPADPKEKPTAGKSDAPKPASAEA